jgi:hypothetical protein
LEEAFKQHVVWMLEPGSFDGFECPTNIFGSLIRHPRVPELENCMHDEVDGWK